MRKALLLLGISLAGIAVGGLGATYLAGAMDMHMDMSTMIATSRPMFTDGPSTVRQGSFQVESGATYTHNSDDSRAWTLPELLLGVGLLPHTEVRLTVPNYIHVRTEAWRTLVDNF